MNNWQILSLILGLLLLLVLYLKSREKTSFQKKEKVWRTQLAGHRLQETNYKLCLEFLKGYYRADRLEIYNTHSNEPCITIVKDGNYEWFRYFEDHWKKKEDKYGINPPTK